jgi:hypothetical protein
MELTHEEVDDYLLKIFTGKQVSYIKRGNNVISLIFRQPDNFARQKANDLYKRLYSQALEEGLLSVDELDKLIRDRGIFTEEDEEKIASLESKLYAQKVLLGKTVKVQARQDRIKGVINKLEEEIARIKYKRLSRLQMSADHKAEEEKTFYLCWACTYKDNEKDLYWPSYDYLISDSDINFKTEVVSEFLRFFNGIPTEIIRIIARSNLWRIRYVTSLKVSEPLFGVPTSQYTNDMLNLAYWSNFYQSVYEMMPDDRPPDSIIEDDEALDAYMHEYYEERSREDASRRGKKFNKGKLSAFDKEEVIITQSNELYQDIKYDKPREAQKIKDRTDIKKRTRRGRK